jgi:hypothetical protein
VGSLKDGRHLFVEYADDEIVADNATAHPAIAQERQSAEHFAFGNVGPLPKRLANSYG